MRQALHVKDTSLESRFIWMQREVNALFKMGKYKEVEERRNDVEVLAASLKKAIHLQTLRDLFFALIHLKKFDEALKTVKAVETHYPKAFEVIDLYNEIVKMASETKNDLLLVSYAQKILTLQRESKSAPLSPAIEFSYIEALKRLGKEREALEVIVSLEPQKLPPKERVRLFYNAGELSLKLKDDAKAKEYFSKCVDTNETSSWKSICEENLKLF